MQPPAHAGSTLADFSTLKMEAIRSSETSVHSRSTRRHIPEDRILHSRKVCGTGCISLQSGKANVQASRRQESSRHTAARLSTAVKSRLSFVRCEVRISAELRAV
jgi:hypothetical protein